MNLTFVLPALRTHPVGGHRVHHEVAERLRRRGHQVVLVHRTPSRRTRLKVRLWAILRYFRTGGLIPWFEFSRGVRVLTRTRLTRRTVPGTDVYVFTAWQSTLDVRAVRGRAAMVALVWDFEFWIGADDQVRQAMRSAFAQPSLTLVAGSAAVKTMLDAMKLPCAATVAPGLDLDVFRVRRDPVTRGNTVGLLLRPDPTKGLADAFEALRQVREAGFEPRVLAVGHWYDELPPWVEWRGTPSDEELAAFYNDVSVFVLPSHAEGFGLPAAEAMACGAAVVSTENGGVAEFATHEQNALLVPPRRPDELGAAIKRMLDEDDLRSRLALAGVETASTMEWDRAVDEVEQVLQSVGPA